VLVAVFKLGDLTRYISESVLLGFMAGAGLLILLSQVGNLLGLESQGDGHQHMLYRLWLTLVEGGPINMRASCLGFGTAILVLVLRWWVRKYRLPRFDMLLALTAVAVIAAALGWTDAPAAGRPAVQIVGDVPLGLPEFHVPRVQLPWTRELAGSALAIAVLGLVEALSIAKSIANQTGQALDYNRQCLAEGVANFVGGLFQCLPGSGSLTRSAINFQAGAVTRMSGVFAAATVALVLLVLAPLAKYIPIASLAGILLVTAIGLIDVRRLRWAVGASRFDAGLVLTTALAAVLVGVEFSILIGVILSILMFVPRAARLKATELTVDAERVLRDRQPNDVCCSRLAVIDFEGEFFFGAAPELDRHLANLTERATAGVRVIVLRLKRTRNPDVVCMERLQRFIEQMRDRGVTVLLAGVRQELVHAMHGLHFEQWLSAEFVFREDAAVAGSATLAAVRYAYELLGDDVCADCPRRIAPEAAALYYMI
jgi:sulfate permease, SulP family